MATYGYLSSNSLIIGNSISKFSTHTFLIFVVPPSFNYLSLYNNAEDYNDAVEIVFVTM